MLLPLLLLDHLCTGWHQSKIPVIVLSCTWLLSNGILQRRLGLDRLVASGIERFQSSSVKLLELLKSYLHETC